MSVPAARVSVCVPVYNGALFLAETMRSVLGQTYQALNVLVSDDGSSDGSAAICREFAADSRVQFWSQPVRLGWVSNCSWLLERAQSELVCIVSHDDIPEPEYVARLAAALEAAPDAALAFCDNAIFGRWRRSRIERQQPIGGTSAERVSQFMATHSDGTAFHALIRRGAIEAAGGLRHNEADDFASDVAWLGRLAAVGDFVRVAEPLYRKRRHDGSASHRWAGWAEERRAAAWAIHCRELLRDALAHGYEQDEREAVLGAAIRRLLAVEPGRPFPFIRDLPLERKAALVAMLLADQPEAARDSEAIARTHSPTPSESVRRTRLATRRIATRTGVQLRRLRTRIYSAQGS